MNKKPYCLVPFIHLHVSNNGETKACCVANIPFGNINLKSKESIWDGDAIKQLRSDFMQNISDKRCANCQKLEATGGKSIRQETFEKFDYTQIDESPKHPVYFDIRFSNVCNFRCRTCWHGASSKWFSDAKQLGTNIGSKAIITNINDLNVFINEWGIALLNAQEFYFAGGEPMVTDEHYLLLSWLIKNKATNCRLRYNTNFSKLEFKNYNALELWSHFEEVEILASIDATHDLGEYVRKEMHWDTILSNREKIRSIDNITFKISPTVSVFNVHDLPELYKTCLELNMISENDIYINILQHPFYYNIQALPKDKKALAAKNLTAFYYDCNNHHLKKSVQEIIHYMMAVDRSHLWPKFLEQTNRIDHLRDESYSDFSI